jgi:hypothetical protein
MESQSARNAIDVVSRALWIAGAVIAFAGLVSIAIVLSREIGALGDVLRQLRELGSTRLEVVAAATASTAVIAILGAPLAVAGAFALSPLFPVGVARRADPNVGLHVDWTVAGVGALVLALTILGIGLVAAAAADTYMRRRAVRPCIDPCGRRCCRWTLADFHQRAAPRR